jgi:hypothetical protein
LQKDILADGMNLKRPEPEGIAPVETVALHDGAAGAHQAWREEEGNRVHQSSRDEGAMDPAPALDQKRLHSTFCESAQQRWDENAAGTVSRQEKDFGPGVAQSPFAAEPRAGVACALAWLGTDDERRGRTKLPNEPG